MSPPFMIVREPAPEVVGNIEGVGVADTWSGQGYGLRSVSRAVMGSLMKVSIAVA